MLMILLLLPKILLILLPIILAVYFTFSKKHRHENDVDFDDGYKAYLD